MYDLDRKVMTRPTEELTDTKQIYQTPLIPPVAAAVLPQFKVRSVT